MKTAVLTVIYKEVEPYLRDFLTSLQNQTDREYELIIVNDGFENVGKFLSKFTIKTRILDLRGSFASIRKQAILWLSKEGFSRVIFADSDDYFDLMRIEKTQNLLNQYAMVCNDLVLFGSDMYNFVPMISRRFFDGQIISPNHLIDGNLMGMSNTGVRLQSILPVIGNIPDDIVAFDWLLYSKALLLGNSCVFTNQIRTFYRQHTNNIAAPMNFTDEQIMRGIRIKDQHYKNLYEDGAVYRIKASEYRQLIARLDNEVFRIEYFNAVRQNKPQWPLWWETIKTDKELQL